MYPQLSLLHQSPTSITHIRSLQQKQNIEQIQYVVHFGTDLFLMRYTIHQQQRKIGPSEWHTKTCDLD